MDRGRLKRIFYGLWEYLGGDPKEEIKEKYLVEDKTGFGGSVEERAQEAGPAGRLSTRRRGGPRSGAAAAGEEGRRLRLRRPWAREEGGPVDGRAAVTGGQ
uniref:Uncharacterized protein n=1 Tax=Oryza rufipogon TaxID=4529 RepID=A0A0E0RH74_ORYRU